MVNTAERAKKGTRISPKGKKQMKFLAETLPTLLSGAKGFVDPHYVQYFSGQDPSSIQTRDIVMVELGSHRDSTTKSASLITSRTSIMASLSLDAYNTSGEFNAHYWAVNVGADLLDEIDPRTGVVVIVSHRDQLFHLANNVCSEITQIGAPDPNHIYAEVMEPGNMILFDLFEGRSVSILPEK